MRDELVELLEDKIIQLEKEIEELKNQTKVRITDYYTVSGTTVTVNGLDMEDS